MRTALRRFGYARCAICPQRSASLMLECAEGRLPPVEAVIESLHAFVPGPLLQCIVDFEHPVHASCVPESYQFGAHHFGRLVPEGVIGSIRYIRHRGTSRSEFVRCLLELRYG